MNNPSEPGKIASPQIAQPQLECGSGDMQSPNANFNVKRLCKTKVLVPEDNVAALLLLPEVVELVDLSRAPAKL